MPDSNTDAKLEAQLDDLTAELKGAQQPTEPLTDTELEAAIAALPVGVAEGPTPVSDLELVEARMNLLAERVELAHRRLDSVFETLQVIETKLQGMGLEIDHIRTRLNV